MDGWMYVCLSVEMKKRREKKNRGIIQAPTTDGRRNSGSLKGGRQATGVSFLLPPSRGPSPHLPREGRRRAVEKAEWEGAHRIRPIIKHLRRSQPMRSDLAAH